MAQWTVCRSSWTLAVRSSSFSLSNSSFNLSTSLFRSWSSLISILCPFSSFSNTTTLGIAGDFILIPGAVAPPGLKSSELHRDLLLRHIGKISSNTLDIIGRNGIFLVSSQRLEMACQPGARNIFGVERDSVNERPQPSGQRYLLRNCRTIGIDRLVRDRAEIIKKSRPNLCRLSKIVSEASLSRGRDVARDQRRTKTRRRVQTKAGCGLTCLIPNIKT